MTIKIENKYKGEGIEETITHLRLELGLTQRQLADMLCMHVSTIQKWEQSLRKPPSSAIQYLTYLVNQKRTYPQD